MPHIVCAVYSRSRDSAAVLTRPVDNNVDVLGSAEDEISKDKGAFLFSFFESFTYFFSFF